MNSKLKKLTDDFLEFEREQKLFDKSLRGIKFWDYIRPYVHTELINQQALPPLVWPNESTKTIKRRKKKLFKEFFGIIGYSIDSIKNRLTHFGRKNIDIIIFEDSNKRMIDGFSVNYHTYQIAKNLIQKFNVLIIDPSRFHQHVYSNYSCKVINTRWFDLFSRIKNKYCNKLKKEEISFLDLLNSRLEKRFNYKSNLYSIYRNYFLIEYNYIKWAENLFSRYEPNLVLFTDNGMKHYLPEAANMFGIISAEIQHGSVSLYQLYTNYRNIDATSLSSKPDYIFTFGKFWHNRYGSNIKKKVLGYPFPDYNNFHNYKNSKGSPNSLLAISTLDHQLVSLMIDFAECFPEYKIYYKLRPEEYVDWKSLYPYDINHLKNLHFIDNNEIPIIEHIANAEYIISSDSTALYEALHLRKKCIVFKGIFWEDQESLINESVAPLVENILELEHIVNSEWKYKLNDSEIYAEYSSKIFCENINDIINK